jgi:hypothetical protein
MPGTSTQRASCSTAAPGWARRTRGSRATERTARRRRAQGTRRDRAGHARDQTAEGMRRALPRESGGGPFSETAP